MPKSDIFETEIALIKDQQLQDFVRYYLNHIVPNYFWTVSASSSGKNHPEFARGEGGLVRHTKVAVMFCQELLRLNTYFYLPDEYKDYAVTALILHDTAKYGTENTMDRARYKDHAKNASLKVNEVWLKMFKTPAPYLLTSAIKCHMGQWSEKDCRPFTQVDKLVHLSDYIASRKFINVEVE